MATAEAERLYRRDPSRKVAIGKDRRFYRSPVFDRNRAIATAQEIRSRKPVQWLNHASGCRPYIDYEATTKPIKEARFFVWRDIGPLDPGRLFFSKAEREPLVSPGYVVVEPHIKPRASPNKDWGFDRWQELVGMAKAVRFVQPDYGLPVLEGVEPVTTSSFREGARLIRDALAYVGPEGGLHHASAAVGVPAVVIYGGFTSPRQTGYSGNENFFTGGEPCGMRLPCDHCKEAMAAITPIQVMAALYRILKQRNQE